MQAWTGRKRQHRASPSNFRALFRASFGCRVGSGDAAEPNGLRPYLGLVDSDSNFVVTEPVIVPKGTLTFQLGGEYHHCDFVHSVRAACGRKVSFGRYRRLRDWVDSYHRCSYGRSADLHFLSRSLGRGHVPSCVPHRCASIEFHWPCCFGQTRSTENPPQRRNAPWASKMPTCCANMVMVAESLTGSIDLSSLTSAQPTAWPEPSKRRGCGEGQTRFRRPQFLLSLGGEQRRQDATVTELDRGILCHCHCHVLRRALRKCKQWSMAHTLTVTQNVGHVGDR